MKRDCNVMLLRGIASQANMTACLACFLVTEFRQVADQLCASQVTW